MKHLLLLSVGALILASCTKSKNGASPIIPVPAVYTVSFSYSDTVILATPPVNDTLNLLLSDANIALGAKVVIRATLNKGQFVNFICNDFLIQNLKYLPTVANHNTTLCITIYPLGKSSLANSFFYDTFVSIYDETN